MNPAKYGHCTRVEQCLNLSCGKTCVSHDQSMNWAFLNSMFQYYGFKIKHSTDICIFTVKSACN